MFVEHGVHRYFIFLDPVDGSLFACVEFEGEERWEAIAQTSVCRRWWTHMSEVMPVDEAGRPRTTPLREVFHFEP